MQDLRSKRTIEMITKRFKIIRDIMKLFDVIKSDQEANAMSFKKDPKPTVVPDPARAVYRQVIKILSKNKRRASGRASKLTIPRQEERRVEYTSTLLFVHAIDEPTVSSSRICRLRQSTKVSLGNRYVSIDTSRRFPAFPLCLSNNVTRLPRRYEVIIFARWYKSKIRKVVEKIGRRRLVNIFVFYNL